MPCPRALHHDHSAATGDRTGTPGFEIPDANHSTTAEYPSVKLGGYLCSISIGVTETPYRQYCCESDIKVDKDYSEWPLKILSKWFQFGQTNVLYNTFINYKQFPFIVSERTLTLWMVMHVNMLYKCIEFTLLNIRAFYSCPFLYQCKTYTINPYTKIVT